MLNTDVNICNVHRYTHFGAEATQHYNEEQNKESEVEESEVRNRN